MLTNNLARWTLFSFIACRELAEKGIQRRHMKAKSTKNMQMLKVRTFHQEFILEAEVNNFLKSQQQLRTMIECDWLEQLSIQHNSLRKWPVVCGEQ